MFYICSENWEFSSVRLNSNGPQKFRMHADGWLKWKLSKNIFSKMTPCPPKSDFCVFDLVEFHEFELKSPHFCSLRLPRSFLMRFRSFLHIRARNPRVFHVSRVKNWKFAFLGHCAAVTYRILGQNSVNHRYLVEIDFWLSPDATRMFYEVCTAIQGAVPDQILRLFVAVWYIEHISGS